METCLSNHGKSIWEGAKAWAAEKTSRTYDANVWDTILTGADADTDGQITSQEAINAMKAHFSITLGADQEAELLAELNAIGADYDTDGTAGLSVTEMTAFLKAYGEEIWRQCKFLQRGQQAS